MQLRKNGVLPFQSAVWCHETEVRLSAPAPLSRGRARAAETAETRQRRPP